MNPKVSVIVPIYNVEKYLDKCVNSLLNQTLTDIEIILVDDGSPDLSGKMADDYQEKYFNIKTVHRENGGLGPARNTGIEYATGDYIAFLDSDDWVQADMYEKLYEIIRKTNADIVVSGHCDVANDAVVLKKQHPLRGQIYDSSDKIREVRKKLFGHSPADQEVEAFPMSVCMSLYNRKMLNENGIRFEKILSEDTIFNIGAYKVAKKIVFTEYTDYCYRKEEQASITQTFSKNKINQYREFLLKLSKLAKEENDDECILRAKRMVIDYCRVYVRIVNNSNASKKEKIFYIKEFAEDPIIQKLWKGYPVQTLPFQQKIFQKFIENHNYRLVVLLNNVRQGISKYRH